jgi:hypothetical protein
MRIVRPRPAALRGTLVMALAILSGLPGTAAPACAQHVWDATLFITPFPSPYPSDWETNPNIASFTVVNTGTQAQDVILYSEVRNAAGVVVTAGRSNPQTIAPGVPMIYNDLTQIAGTQQHDAEIEDLVRRSGRLPEGEYVACVAVTNLSGFVLAQECTDFSITYPDPPMLITPADGEVVSSAAPILQWTPLQVPADYTLQYVLQVAEVLPNQLPEAALSSNVLHYENLDVGTTNLPYPIDALPLNAGKTYAWRVVAMDQYGYAAAANGGSSEIWTFQYDDGSTPEPPGLPRVAGTTFQLRVAESDVPNEGENAGAYVASWKTGLAALCATSEQWTAGQVDTTLDFDVRAPFFGNDTVSVAVYYAVDSLGLRESQQWALRGTSATRNVEYFARGDCDGASETPGFLGPQIHWIALRPKEYKLSDYLAQAFGWNQTDPLEINRGSPPAHEGIELAFGTGILSFRSTTVGDGELFPAEAEFFDDNEIDVLPGLNAYGVVWMPEGSIWDWLRQWGWDENKLELQGFVGMANTVTVGLELEKTKGGEADVTLQQKFLVLRIGLPKRTPQLIPWIRSMQGGIQFSVEDTLTTGVGPGTETKAGLDFILKFTWTWEINDEVSIVWAGGFDRNIEYDTKEGLSKKVDLVLSGECQCVWESPFNVGNWWIGNPKLELHYNLTTMADVSLAGAFQTGWGEAPPFTIGGSLTWKKELVVPPEYQTLKSGADLAWAKYMDALAAFKGLPEPEDPAEFQRRKLEGTLEDDELEYDRKQRAKDRAREEHAAAEAKLNEALKANPNALTRKAFDWRHPEWRIRATAGNVGFMDLLDFVRSLW